MKEQPSQKRPLIYYGGIVVIAMLLLNIFVFPAILQPRVHEATYDQFVKLVDEGKVTHVSYEENMMVFAAADEEGRPVFYKTGVWPWDEKLTQRLLDEGVKFASVIPTQASPLMSFLISFVLPMAFFFLMGRLLMRSLNKKMGGANALQLGKANAKIYIEAQTGKTFQDVAGQDEAKEALWEIVDFLHDPGRYGEIGAKLPKGALLVGPPGTGKTLLAKAVAGEAKVPFFSISGSEFVEMFVGMGAAKVRDLFKQANEKAPCIVFIDEIDTIGKRRDNGGISGGNDEREQTLNQLLSEMDGFDGKKGVVILAATNRPEILDPALLRPGRFDRRIPVELPDLQGRLAILKVHAKHVKMEENLDLTPIARATSGASGAELANIINEAALRAVKMGRKAIAREDLEESVETVIAGYQRKGAVISDQEKKIIAYHEIGHALVAARQKGSAPVTKITIIPRTSGALGYTMQVEEDERVLLSREDAMRRLSTLTGGRAAEELVFGQITSGAANDIEKITRLARAMVTRYGMSSQFDMMALETVSNQYLGGDTALACSPETAARIDQEVKEIIQSAHQMARDILAADQEKLHRLASFLLEKETITGEEFMAILEA
ncbi:MAG: ATP-dependent zinc metalloprotease FtsH [Clostridia bacterium]|nr:ATP-dependent zinc metalloprotease FtsH [Clostridia bacterium]